ncbi:MAG: Tol-Pal system beta propeller repeat protein TolB [Rickettsiales bacterium]|nr:Tol-Pal system beta propeller repeat protein TolB [Rickettsiales bacterium]
MKQIIRLFSLILCYGLIIATPYFQAQAQIKVNITRGTTDPLPIALNPVYESDAEAEKIGNDIVRLIDSNLTKSGLFNVLDQQGFIERINNAQVYPHYASWRSINAQTLLIIDLSFVESDKIKIGYRLWNTISEELLHEDAHITTRTNWRRLGHLISDRIYHILIGEDPYFDTRIVYIAEKGLMKDRKKYLAIMDQDGGNHELLTRGDHLVLTPRFSPVRQQIIYMSYEGRTPSVYLYDLEEETREKLGDFPGMSYAPRFSPSNDKAIMSASLDGNSEIYEFDLNTRQVKRLTRNPSIDTSPSYSPDEQSIVFNSDRGGSQQLYVMDRDGTNVRRISFGQGRYGTPVWSPRGDLIAFTKMNRGKFHIGVMRPDGTGERIITESYLDEGPTWAPNGRVIMFTRQTPYRSKRNPGTTYIYSIDLTGYNERRINIPGEGSDPAWSPILPL